MYNWITSASTATAGRGMRWDLSCRSKRAAAAEVRTPTQYRPGHSPILRGLETSIVTKLSRGLEMRRVMHSREASRYLYIDALTIQVEAISYL